MYFTETVEVTELYILKHIPGLSGDEMEQSIEFSGRETEIKGLDCQNGAEARRLP